MIINNYSQFAKKTLIIGIDRKYFILLLFLFAIISIIDTLVAIFLVLAVYFYSVYLFYKDAYWFDKALIKLALKKYKHIHRIIIGR